MTRIASIGVRPRPLARHCAGRPRIATQPRRKPSRVRTELARDVRTIGTRAPSTTPAASAWARKVRFLASILPASRSGTTRICARPATGEMMFLIRAASGSMALSKARGPSRSPPVICPRSAILQSAAASMVDGIFVRHGFDRREDRNARLAHPYCDPKIDGVLHDVAFHVEIGEDVDRRIGDEQGFRHGREHP